MRLIDADELENPLNWKQMSTRSYKIILENIRSTRTVDAEPIKHAHWKRIKRNIHECSECGVEWYYDLHDIDEINYCPFCGAKMDENNK